MTLKIVFFFSQQVRTGGASVSGGEEEDNCISFVLYYSVPSLKSSVCPLFEMPTLTRQYGVVEKRLRQLLASKHNGPIEDIDLNISKYGNDVDYYYVPITEHDWAIQILRIINDLKRPHLITYKKKSIKNIAKAKSVQGHVSSMQAKYKDLESKILASLKDLEDLSNMPNASQLERNNVLESIVSCIQPYYAYCKDISTYWTGTINEATFLSRMEIPPPSNSSSKKVSKVCGSKTKSGKTQNPKKILK